MKNKEGVEDEEKKIKEEIEYCMNKNNEIKQNCKSMRIKLKILYQNSKKLYQLYKEEREEEKK